MEWGSNIETAEKIEGIKRIGTRAYFQEFNKKCASFAMDYYEWIEKGEIFCSGDSCLGIGFGVGKEITSSNLEEMEDFVRKNKSYFSLHLEVTPFADESFLKKLQVQGYTLDHFLNAWIIDLTEWQPVEPTKNEAVCVEEVHDGNVQEWAWAVALGISNDDYQADVSPESVKAFWQAPENTAFLVKENGKCIGGGCVTIEGELAELFMAATVPAKRCKGYQKMLIDARLGFAKAAGCTHATVTTKPNTSSARNVKRSGFTIAYDKAVLRSRSLD